jgi:protein tyrosine/serine phosphatase
VLGDVVRDGDLRTIAQPMDVLGINWYSSYTAAAPERAAVHLADLPSRAAMFLGIAPLTAPLGFTIVPAPGLPWGGAHRQLTPGGLRRALDWVAEIYPDHPDIVITENGIGYADIPSADGIVHDDERIAYLSWVLEELSDAVAAGARVRGYHAWSSFDNLQMMAGFTQRFGLVHVDNKTLARTPKDSFAWFGEVVTTGRVPSVAGSDSFGDHLGIDVAGVRNARGVGGLRTLDGSMLREGVLYRSAGLHSLGDEGRAALAALDVRTVLDLRGEAEAQLHPDEVPDARVVRLPLHEPTDVDTGLVVGAAGGHMPLREVYAEIVRERGDRVVAGVREVAHAPGAVLVHCTAGKDRTGVFVALLLAAVGVCDDDIVRTYAESRERLGDEFAAEVAQMLSALSPAGAAVPQETVDDILGSPAEYIDEMLAEVRAQHGTVAAYLFAHGLEEEELRMLRERLLG